MAGDRPSRRGSRVVYREVRPLVDLQYSIWILSMKQVYNVKKAAVAEWQKHHSKLSLNQAPDSDEELEIDDDTKIILIDKQVTASYYLFFFQCLFCQDIEDDSNDTDYTPGGQAGVDDFPAKRVNSFSIKPYSSQEGDVNVTKICSTLLILWMGKLPDFYRLSHGLPLMSSSVNSARFDPLSQIDVSSCKTLPAILFLNGQVCRLGDRVKLKQFLTDRPGIDLDVKCHDGRQKKVILTP